MILTEEQKQELKNLKQHPWFKILEMIELEASRDLGKILSIANLDDENVLKTIKKNQIYMTARQDLLQNVDNHLQSIYTPINSL